MSKSDIRDQIQELAHEYERKMKANDLYIEQVKSMNATYDMIRGKLQAILDNEDQVDTSADRFRA